MRVDAYAKINWYLKILSRNNDGYHSIATLFQSVSLKDELGLKKIKEGFSFKTNSENIPKDCTNLVLKAVEILCNNIKKIPSGLEIFLEKNIPVEAGLGGGSADAAAVLKSLNILWELNLSERKLFALASCLGADVPFNIKGGLALAFGRGEKLKFYNRRSRPELALYPNEASGSGCLPLLIIKPNIGISTKWAYEEFDKLNILNSENAATIRALSLQEADALIKAVKLADFENIKKYAVNDFEKVVYLKHPGLEKIKNNLIKHGAETALLCGSGSAIFGLFKDSKIREEAYRYFSEKKNIKAYKAETVN